MHFTFVHAADLHLDAVLPGPSGLPFSPSSSGPLPGGAREGVPNLDGLLREAPFVALRRLVDLCISSGASFLLLSGDIYDARQGSLKARLEFRDACERLQQRGIEVFWARGNHDPLLENGSGNESSVSWPDNLKIFSERGDSFALRVLESGELAPSVALESGAAAAALGARGRVLIHGISHADPRVGENLALKLLGSRAAAMGAGGDARGFRGLESDAGGGNFEIGVLHCAVGGNSRGHALYAPCALTDLTLSPPHYWALGHVHQPAALSRKPCVFYAGSLQGLHINENGPRGCYLVRVENGAVRKTEFAALAPLRWEKASLDLSAASPFFSSAFTADINNFSESADKGSLDEGGNVVESEQDDLSLDGLEKLIIEAVKGFNDGSLKKQGVMALFCRVELRGRTCLDSVLRRPGSLEELAKRVNAALESGREPGALMSLLKDIKLSTMPDVDMEAALKSDNLVGETLRRALAFREAAAREATVREASVLADADGGKTALSEEEPGRALAPYLALLQSLYAHDSARNYLELPGGAELADLALEAVSLCLDLFETERGAC